VIILFDLLLNWRRRRFYSRQNSRLYYDSSPRILFIIKIVGNLFSNFIRINFGIFEIFSIRNCKCIDVLDERLNTRIWLVVNRWTNRILVNNQYDSVCCF
jgi:hypothetical protein